mgnify:CR=1 FL=1
MAQKSLALTRRAVLISAILASSMAFIDGTALNVALPSIQEALGLNGQQMLWTVNAYTLFLASLMLVGGALGDLFGKKKIFGLGIILFVVFSAACGLASNGTFLIVSRALQGIGGALMVPGSLSLITACYPRQSLGQAIGTWSMFSAFTTILGPVLGGWLADEGLWRFIFYINLPLGALAAFLLFRYVSEPVKPLNYQLDWRGALLVTVGMLSLTLGFIEAGEYGFEQVWVTVIIAAGLVFLLLFVWQEKRCVSPLLPLELFRSRTFSGANLLTLLVYGALAAVLFFLPLNLIQIQAYPEAQAGYAILPFGGLIALMGRFSGRLTDYFGPKFLLIAGPVLTGAAFWWLGSVGYQPGFDRFWLSFFPPLALAGIGMGLTVVPLTTAVMNCVSESQSGIASGVNNTIARLANVLFLALIGALALISFQKQLAERARNSALSEDKQMLIINRAENLAATRAPAEWPASQKEQVQNWVRENFLTTFRLSARSAAFLCWLSAVISAFLIEGKPKKIRLEQSGNT